MWLIQIRYKVGLVYNENVEVEGSEPLLSQRLRPSWRSTRTHSLIPSLALAPSVSYTRAVMSSSLILSKGEGGQPAAAAQPAAAVRGDNNWREGGLCPEFAFT